jgi:hypothetical protein
VSDHLSDIERSELLASRLDGMLRSLYQSLGELAPSLSDDAMVVAVFEMARIFGDCAFRFSELRAQRNGVQTPRAPLIGVIDEVLRRSLERDSTGALTLYCVSSLLGPRLMISLRDAAELVSGPGDVVLRQRIEDVASIVLAQIHRVGELASRRTMSEDMDALNHARELDEMLIRAHFAESFTLYP